MHNLAGYRSVPHHHGEAETGGFVLSGRARIYFGKNYGRLHRHVRGDWVFVPPHMPHVECNLDRNNPLTWMTTAPPDNIVVNLPQVDDADLRDWARPPVTSSQTFTDAVTLTEAPAEVFDVAFTRTTAALPVAQGLRRRHGGPGPGRGAAHATDGKTVHSMHSYFMRPVDIGAEVRYEVELLRDGRATPPGRCAGTRTARSSTPAWSASPRARPGAAGRRPPRSTSRPPTTCRRRRRCSRGATAAPAPEGSREYWAHGRSFDMRHVPGPVYLDVVGGTGPQQAVWVKPFDALRPVPGIDDAQRDAAALAYVCDYTILEPALRVLGAAWADEGLVTASLDHAMWFHRPVVMGDWLLYAQEVLAVEDGRGTCTGRSSPPTAPTWPPSSRKVSSVRPAAGRRCVVKVAIVGGGPGALPGRTAQAARRGPRDHRLGAQRPRRHLRLRRVVFSDETLGSIEGADEVVHQRMESRFARWTDIDVDVDGQSFTVGGQGFAAMSRKELLQILQERVAELGVTVHYRSLAPDVDELRATHDLVVACDGRTPRSAPSTPTPSGPRSTGGTTSTSGWAPTWSSRPSSSSSSTTEWGTMQIHGYPFGDTGSTFIVEMHDDVWKAAGFDATEHQEFPPGSPTSSRSPGSARSSPTTWPGTRCSPTTRSG